MAHQIILDCDPGQDDAICLLMAMADTDLLHILGVTAVAGNVPLALTQRNARIMCEIANRRDIPVFAGCDRPMVSPLVTAEKVHGNTGIDGVQVYEPEHSLQSVHAVDFIINTLNQAKDNSVTLAPTGPLTNIAMALVKAPEIVGKIRQIVLMGGAMIEGGNHTPSAEFNIYVDAHAAKVVFECGRPIVAMGLDVTHQVLATPSRIESISSIGNPQAKATAGMLGFFNRFDTKKYGTEGAPLHDPCTVAYLLEPGLFKTKPCNVDIETQSQLTLGHTAVDFWHVTDKPHNTEWAYDVDADGFYDLLCRELAKY